MAANTTGPINANPSGNLLTPQLGLLEDDLAYRLSLLCVNVLQPLMNQYPGLKIVSGFRQTNDGVSQHELGEAVDLQIANQTPALLYEVADWIQKNLNFDQLVLNWTNIGTGAGWIHVSFSPTSLRNQVLTKDLADGFTSGLFLVTPLTGNAASAMVNSQATDGVMAELMNMQTRQMRLNQTPSTLIPAANTANGPSPVFTNTIFGTIFSSPDVSNWAVTANISTFIMTPGNMHIEFDRQADWASIDIGGGVLQQATLWVLLNINKQLYATGAEQLKPNQQNKSEPSLYSQWIGTNMLSNANTWGIMSGYVPAVGETVGIMVTQGSEKDDDTWTVKERSDVLYITWPPDGQPATFFGNTQPLGRTGNIVAVISH